MGLITCMHLGWNNSENSWRHHSLRLVFLGNEGVQIAFPTGRPVHNTSIRIQYYLEVTAAPMGGHNLVVGNVKSIQRLLFDVWYPDVISPSGVFTVTWLLLARPWQ